MGEPNGGFWGVEAWRGEPWWWVWGIWLTLCCAPQKMVESQRQNVRTEFERLRRLLAEEEQRLLQRLEEEELEVLPPLRESAARLGQQSAQLAELIAELEGRCQLPALGLLQVSAPRVGTRGSTGMACRRGAGKGRKPRAEQAT